MMAVVHSEAHHLAGKIVKIDLGEGSVDYRLEDWWDRVVGSTWMSAEYNHPACFIYATRINNPSSKAPRDDEVVYGKIGPRGHLVHITEIVKEAE